MNQTEEKSMKKKIAKGRLVRSTAITALCVFLGIVVAFEYKSIKAAAGTTAENNTLVDYQSTIIELSKNVEALKQQKAELEQKVNTFENSNNEERFRSLEEANANLRAMLGLREAKGEGIVITLNYADPYDISRGASNLLLLIN